MRAELRWGSGLDLLGGADAHVVHQHGADVYLRSAQRETTPQEQAEGAGPFKYRGGADMLSMLLEHMQDSFDLKRMVWPNAEFSEVLVELADGTQLKISNRTQPGVEQGYSIVSSRSGQAVPVDPDLLAGLTFEVHKEINLPEQMGGVSIHRGHQPWVCKIDAIYSRRITNEEAELLQVQPDYAEFQKKLLAPDKPAGAPPEPPVQKEPFALSELKISPQSYALVKTRHNEYLVFRGPDGGYWTYDERSLREEGKTALCRIANADRLGPGEKILLEPQFETQQGQEPYLSSRVLSITPGRLDPNAPAQDKLVLQRFAELQDQLKRWHRGGPGLASQSRTEPEPEPKASLLTLPAGPEHFALVKTGSNQYLVFRGADGDFWAYGQRSLEKGQLQIGKLLSPEDLSPGAAMVLAAKNESGRQVVITTSPVASVEQGNVSHLEPDTMSPLLKTFHELHAALAHWRGDQSSQPSDRTTQFSTQPTTPISSLNDLRGEPGSFAMVQTKTNMYLVFRGPDDSCWAFGQRALNDNRMTIRRVMNPEAVGEGSSMVLESRTPRGHPDTMTTSRVQSLNESDLASLGQKDPSPLVKKFLELQPFLAKWRGTATADSN